MMTTIFLILTSIVIFFISLVSPKKAEQIQKKTDKVAHRLKAGSDGFWNPFMFVAHSSIEGIRKIINWAAGWGKGLRHKVMPKKSKKSKSTKS